MTPAIEQVPCQSKPAHATCMTESPNALGNLWWSQGKPNSGTLKPLHSLPVGLSHWPAPSDSCPK